jgi:hypothetical protein
MFMARNVITVPKFWVLLISSEVMMLRLLLSPPRSSLKPERKRPLGRPRHRWVNNIRMDLKEIGWDGMGWIDLTQDRGQCEHGNEPPGSIKC